MPLFPERARNLIIGTAGHIDHGKTSLVKALTGVDTDRLKEEKARGITIDLGFAYRPAAPGSAAATLGFVDVPGHERLVRNMLAGATGIDLVLLVVAADDGPMPQTREHLAILDLLGLSRGVVAITKADLVDPARLDAVRAEVHTLLASTGLAGAGIVAVSSLTGLGIDELMARLLQAQQALPPARVQGHFRLAVDRSFSLAGIGTVVTGTAVAGRVAVGDRLLLSPSGKAVRVRGLHAQNLGATEGHAGQRLALNLAGVEKTEVRRGDWVLAEAAHAPTQRLDARIRVLPGESRALAHWTPVHLHLGAEDVGARVVVIEDGAIAAGAQGWAQLELDRPIGALRGDRFILRDQSATRTLGGGVVLDAFAAPLRRHKRLRVPALQALSAATPAEALAGLLALAPVDGVDLKRFATLCNQPLAALQAQLDAVPHRTLEVGPALLAHAPGRLEQQLDRIAEVLAAHHKRAPDSPGLTLEQLRKALRDKPAATVFTRLIQELQQAGVVQRSGPYVRRAGHETALLAAEQKMWERLHPWLIEGGIHPPKLSEMLQRDRTLHRDPVVRLLNKLARMGKLYAVGTEYFILPQHLLQLALQSQALAEADPNRRLNVKALRESAGVSRHLSMPLVEFFDHIGFTKRDPVGRKIRRDAREMFG